MTRRFLKLFLVSSFFLLGLELATAEHAPPPATAASTYPAFDAHAEEHVTIAADPYNTKDKASCFRLDYLKLGFLPIRIIVTNDGDKPISLEQARINFITADGGKIAAAEPDDVERRATNLKNPSNGVRLPIPGLTGKPKSKDPKIEADFHEFEYQAIVVEPHTTRAGFLFYDIDGLNNPLKGAKLYLRRLQSADGKDLFYFEIPFDKYLAGSAETKKSN
ncbi:hypothetical protein ACPOL_6104 [Acidisarcina polymorpha]|uniref:DUF4352 domain-containing protein n=1 Tax=Acidisarcina polymorpha TaxID=2211140 RepID=A0A2Z5G8P9_9BACT|nr:hypothetical protein ACPOL_6104 [Acidisarcina polymorpha]